MTSRQGTQRGRGPTSTGCFGPPSRLQAIGTQPNSTRTFRSTHRHPTVSLQGGVQGCKAGELASAAACRGQRTHGAHMQPSCQARPAWCPGAAAQRIEVCACSPTRRSRTHHVAGAAAAARGRPPGGNPACTAGGGEARARPSADGGPTSLASAWSIQLEAPWSPSQRLNTSFAPVRSAGDEALATGRLWQTPAGRPKCEAVAGARSLACTRWERHCWGVRGRAIGQGSWRVSPPVPGCRSLPVRVERDGRSVGQVR